MRLTNIISLGFALNALNCIAIQAQEDVSGLLHSCLLELERGDTTDAKYYFEKVSPIAGSNLPGPQLQSLQACSNGVFGSDAVYVEAAGAWMTEVLASEYRAECELDVAEADLNDVKKQFEDVRTARAFETQIKTMAACIDVYSKEREKAIMNPICNGLFEVYGVPDTEYEFENSRLVEARLKLVLAEMKVAELRGANFSEPTDSGPTESVGRLEKCRTFLSE